MCEDKGNENWVKDIESLADHYFGTCFWRIYTLDRKPFYSCLITLGYFISKILRLLYVCE